MEKFRAPAVPLMTVDPFFSVWSGADELYDEVTRHWTNQRHHLSLTLSVDEKFYRVMGHLYPKNDRYITEFEPLPQSRLEILPLTTRYTFENSKIRLTLSFMTPLLPDDLMLFSRPVSYLSYRLEAKDGKKHAVTLYLDVAAELAVNDTTQSVTLGRTDYSITASAGFDKMLIRDGDDHRIEWGTLHLIAPGCETKHLAAIVRNDQMHDIGKGDEEGPLNPVNYTTPNRRKRVGRFNKVLEVIGETLPDYEGDEIPVEPVMPLLCADKTIELDGSAEGFWCVGYDDEKSLQYFGENIEAYWKKDGASFSEVAAAAIKDYDSIVARADAFDRDLCERAGALGEDYKNIVCLAYRQTVAGHKLTFHDGEIQFVSKENYSNGCAATVDVTYPSIPMFLIYNPKLVEGMLNPIFKLIEKGLWHYDFAPHDAGRYPLVNGQVYGMNKPDPLTKQMPVEECGNMILCVAALCHAEKDDTYFLDHFDLLKQWADYLIGSGFDPENQLCTDDFAGHLAHNCNLSIKAIMGLGAFAKMCDRVGKDGGAYRAKAEEFTARWLKAADDGDHYRLAFDQPGTWSVKYNLVWDRLFGLDLFPAAAAEKEIAYYKKMVHAFGLPLDNRADYSKSDWQMWSTVLTDDKEYFDLICGRMVRFLAETPDRVPFTDWYYTSVPFHRGFQARTVQGGLFIPMLKFE